MLTVTQETKLHEKLLTSAYPSFSMPISNNHHSEESRAQKLVYILPDLSGGGRLYIYIIFWVLFGVFFCPKRLILYTLFCNLTFSFDSSMDIPLGQLTIAMLFVVIVAQSCLTLCDPMDCSTPGLPDLQHLPELAQPHVH